MSYEKFKSVDGIEFIPLKEPEQIDIEAQNILEDKQTTSITTCCICLENNNKTSVKLKCRCGTKIHSKCFKEMKKNKMKKCPLCSDIVIKNHESNPPNPCSIFLICIIPIYICYIYIMTHSIGTIIFYPSTIKYCDNNHKMCEYFSVDGILTMNTIEEKYNNFNVKYYLSSSYNWTTNDYKNGTCYNVETHIYDSYETALIIKDKSIGETKNIYVSYSNPKNCKLKYKWYNPNKYYIYKYCMYSAIIIPFCLLAPLYFHYKYGNFNNIPEIFSTNNILEHITNIFFGFIFVLAITSWIVSILVVDYYAYLY